MDQLPFATLREVTPSFRIPVTRAASKSLATAASTSSSSSAAQTPRAAASPSLLDEAARYELLAPSVARLRAVAAANAGVLTRARVSMISSTSAGGGVAEMLHQFIPLLRELNVDVKWYVLVPRLDVAPAFFSLTKAMHNALHGEGDALFSDADRELFDAVGDAAVDDLLARFTPDAAHDAFIVHDPQPASMLRRLAATGATTAWRCHIGVDTQSAVADRAWGFLERDLMAATACIFSTTTYIRMALAGRLADKSFVVTPGLAPLSNKSLELSYYETVNVLVRGGTWMTRPASPTQRPRNLTRSSRSSSPSQEF